VVEAVHELSEIPKAIGEVYNIGSNREISILELAERVKARANSASEIRLIPYEEAYEAGFVDFRRRVPSLEKIHGAIEWEPTMPLDDTIDQIIAYIQEELTHG
jgi:UDP-glucose 4-epimerase